MDPGNAILEVVDSPVISILSNWAYFEENQGILSCLPTDTVAEADLERCQKEVNQLKVDHEVAMEKKDRQV